MPTVNVLNAQGQPAGTLELKADVFGEVSVPLLHQAVVRELADRRVGTHDTKGRSEVSGGGRKPWKQKGTGRARQGSIRATQWKGGGKPFGPTPRSYDKAMPRQMRRGVGPNGLPPRSYDKAMPRQMRREALREAVASTIAGETLRVVESVSGDGKTKTLVTGLGQLGLKPVSTLVVVATLADTLLRAARNVPWLTVETPDHVSVYQ